MPTTQENYKLFATQLRQLRHLQTATEFLDWDQKVYMPPRAATGRAEQIALLSELAHRQMTEPRFVELVQTLSESSGLSTNQQLNVRQVSRYLRREARVSAELVRLKSEAASNTHERWLEARKLNKFAVVSKDLENLLSLTLEYGAARAESNESVYDALIDLYEPEATSAEIKGLFDSLAPQLTSLLQRIIASPAFRKGRPNLSIDLSKDQQKQFFFSVLEKLGFDLHAGRLDETVHPFCATVGLHDVRLTTRYSDGFFAALLALIHEAGHGMYEQGLSAELFGLPQGEACSLGVHESQSLLWEKHIGRSREFWKIMLSDLTRISGRADLDAESIYRAINWVQPGLNRVNADEVSYSLHVVIRFELEQQLCARKIVVTDLPEAWSELYRRYLAVTPLDDLTGVLQDTHWYGGAFGYFPTYTLGAMYAAEFHKRFDDVRRGMSEFDGSNPYPQLLEWLQKNIFSVGRTVTSMRLAEGVLGRAPNSGALIEHLTNRYAELYDL